VKPFEGRLSVKIISLFYRLALLWPLTPYIREKGDWRNKSPDLFS